MSTPTSPENPSDTPKASSGHRRNGKVAQLDKALRDQINRLMDDGFTYLEIIHQLGEAGAELTENNLSTWKSGGYTDWLAEQHRLDKMRVRQEFAKDLVKENDGVTTHQAASQIAALNLCDIVDDFDPEILKKALLSDPETYVKLLNAYTRLLNAMPKLSSAEVECERRREGQEEHAARLKKERHGGKSAGLSDEARREMEDKLNLL
jgi:hypothetical protein